MLSGEVQIQIGKLAGKVVEYVAHQYLHSTKFHMEHHQTSNKFGMIDPNYFKPWFMSVPGIKEKGGLALLVLMFRPLKPFFPDIYETVQGEAKEYFDKHARSHRDPYLIWDELPGHAMHHILQEGYWGVRDSSLDHLLGTAPKIDPDKFESIKKKYIERGEEALSVIEKEAKVREQKMMNSFYIVIDGMRVVGDQRRRLNRFVEGVRFRAFSLSNSI